MLASVILSTSQQLIATKYFTARVRADKAKILRQSSYLQALDVRGGIDFYYGRYQKKAKECRNCQAKWNEYEEKMSDVMIATELLRDAFKDMFDTAILISADADLLPPIEAIKSDFPKKKIVIGFPPRRDNTRLTKIAHSTFRIGRGRLRKCQLPNSVKKPDGYVLTRPKEWS